MSDKIDLLEGIRQFRDPKSEKHEVKKWPKIHVVEWRGRGRTDYRSFGFIDVVEKEPIGWLGKTSFMSPTANARVEVLSTAGDTLSAQRSVYDLRFMDGLLTSIQAVRFEVECFPGTLPRQWEVPSQPISPERAVRNLEDIVQVAHPELW